MPQQPTPKELDRDPLLHRFIIVFDRECSNYKLISQLWQQRIGAITYRKNFKDKSKTHGPSMSSLSKRCRSWGATAPR